MFHIFARSRWNGGYKSVDQQGLFANVHGLLPIVYTRWAAIMQGTNDAMQASASVHPSPQRRGAPAQQSLPLVDVPLRGAGGESQQLGASSSQQGVGDMGGDLAD